MTGGDVGDAFGMTGSEVVNYASPTPRAHPFLSPHKPCHFEHSEKSWGFPHDSKRKFYGFSAISHMLSLVGILSKKLNFRIENPAFATIPVRVWGVK